MPDRIRQGGGPQKNQRRQQTRTLLPRLIGGFYYAAGNQMNLVMGMIQGQHMENIAKRIHATAGFSGEV